MSIAPTELLDPVLNSSHRCDRCGSRAYVLAIIVWGTHDGELYFCNHHWHEHREAIRPILAALVDETYLLDTHIKDDHWVEGKAAK